MARNSASGRGRVVLDAFRSQLWPLPSLAIVLAATLGVVLPRIDARVDEELAAAASEWLFNGGPDAARAVLGVISGSLITLTSLTFSLTVVTLQLASGQFSPRLLRTFSQDRYVHVTLALFLATFVYSLAVLRTVRTSGDGQAGVVPQIAVTTAFLLTLASLLSLVLFLAHLAREIRVETMLRRVHAEARTTADRTLDPREDPVSAVTLPTPPPEAVPLLAATSGFLTFVHEGQLLGAAVDAGAVVLLERPLGSSLVAGTPVGWAWAAGGGRLSPDAADGLQRCLARVMDTGPEPTSAHDVTFGLKQLTDVAAKALSPGINDPRTAIHALGHSAALLCELSQRSLGPSVGRDDDGAERVFWAQQGLGALLDLAVSAPRRYGAADPDVLARLYALLAELAWSSDEPTHRAAVREQLARLRSTAGQQDFDAVERERLDELGRTVDAALDGRHRSPALAVAT